MELVEFSSLVRQAGIVGAGGAGFPTYAKLDQRTEIIVLNCAECEPLLKLHRQLLQVHAYEIMQALQMVAEVVGAKEIVIGVKGEYKDTVRAVKERIGEFPMMRIKLLDSVYPMGDEVVLIYEATGRVVKPGGLPVESGVAVFNVETMYNLYRAIKENHPVTDKIVSVVGEVENPISVRVPLGCKIEDVVALAGEITTKEPVFLIGGPMMGFIGNGEMPVTKTTNAILVLPKDHQIIRKKQENASTQLKRAASACCQCETCSCLCPRHALGHPIEPHAFMRAASSRDFSDIGVFLNTFYCSGCGVCEMYACPQGLSPRSLIQKYKGGLRAAGIKAPEDPVVKPVEASREYRKVPEQRLEARIGLAKYDKPAPLQDETAKMPFVVEKMGQHIGAPAEVAVAVGDMVKVGDLIGKASHGLSTNIHASISGKVVAVTKDTVSIQRV